MKSKFYNDMQNEKILHDLMIKFGLVEALRKEGFIYIIEDIDIKNQGLGVDFRCKYNDNIVNIDEKTRFTIPIYDNNINYTFALEISNSDSRKKGWFIDKNKITDYYLLLYPIFDKDIGSNNRNYNITRDLFISGTNIKLKGVMAQLISVEKLRNYFSNKIDKIKLVNFIKNYYIINESDNGIIYFDINFNKIDKNDKGQIYFTYNSFLKERPINLILNQNIYNSIREFEFHLIFK